MESENKENKDKYSVQVMGFCNYDEEQFYTDVIVPKINELSELLDSRKIPHLFSVVFKEDKKVYGAGLIIHPNERTSPAVAKMCACSEILNRTSDPLELAILFSMAKEGK